MRRWERWEVSKLEKWKRWEDSEAARLERLEGSDVASWERWLGQVVRGWQGGKSAKVMRWQGGRVVKWYGGSFLVLFKGVGHRVSRRFHLFVSDVDQQWNEGQDRFKIIWRGQRDGRTLLRSNTSC